MSTTEHSLARRASGWLLETVLVVAGALIIASLLRAFVGQMFVIPSGSMENTLQVHDRVVVSKFGGFTRGDVVVFEDPGKWLPPSTPDAGAPLTEALEFIGILPNSDHQYLIKRVIGMPGDRVRLGDDGRIEINGAALDETSYLFSAGGVQVVPATVPFDVVVPKGHIFVLGDHRNDSNDSRCRLTNGSDDPAASAFVPISNVVGAAVAIVAPLDRLTTFTVPTAFGDIPDPADPAPEKPILHHVEPGCN